jgi:hypothetical protein
MVTLPSLFHSNNFYTRWYQCFWSHFTPISSHTAQSIWEQTLPCLYIGLGQTQRQARELISGPCLGAKARVLSFSRTQYRAVADLIGRNTLRRHLHLMGLSDSPLCRRCGAEDETSAHILCECETLASLRHVYLGSFFLEPEDIKSTIWGPSGTLGKQQGSHELIWGKKRPSIKA